MELPGPRSTTARACRSTSDRASRSMKAPAACRLVSGRSSRTRSANSESKRAKAVCRCAYRTHQHAACRGGEPPNVQVSGYRARDLCKSLLKFGPRSAARVPSSATAQRVGGRAGARPALTSRAYSKASRSSWKVRMAELMRSWFQRKNWTFTTGVLLRLMNSRQSAVRSGR